MIRVGGLVAIGLLLVSTTGRSQTPPAPSVLIETAAPREQVLKLTVQGYGTVATSEDAVIGVMRLVAALGRAGVDHWPRRPPPSPGNGHRCQRSRQACRTTIPRTHSRHGRRRPSVLTQAPLRNGGRLLPNDWPGNKRRALHFKPYAAHSRTRRARDREAKGVKKIAKR
jgi:hypothetical protein